MKRGLVLTLLHRVWDARKLDRMPISLLGDDAEGSSDDDNSSQGPLDFDADIVNEYLDSDAGKGGFRAEYKHDKSASSAYWDPRGRSIVSTSYDDTLRCTSRLCRQPLSVYDRLTRACVV